MLPIIKVQIGSNEIKVYMYAIMMVISIAFALITLPRSFVKMGLSIAKAVINVLVMGACALIGARLVYVILYIGDFRDIKEVFHLSFSDFTLYGGILGALIFALCISKKYKFSLLRWLDSVVVIGAVSLIITRIGCLFNGCCYGKVTDGVWGIPMIKGGIAYRDYIKSHPLALFSELPHIHPTQIYEIIAILVALFVSLVIIRIETNVEPIKGYHRDGLAVISFGITLTIGRLIVFFFREFPYASDISNLIRGPVTYGFALLVLLILFKYIYYNK